MPPERLSALYSQHCIPLVAIHWPDYPTRDHSPQGSSLQHIGRIFRLLPTPFTFDAFNEGDRLELLGSYLVRKKKLEWLSVMLIFGLGLDVSK